MTNEKKLNININEGDEFFAQEASVSYNPTIFNLDFRRLTPRIDMRTAESNIILLRHNVVMLEPYVAKKMLELLSTAVEKYEKDFGKIEVPEPIKKMEDKLKKQIHDQNQNAAANSTDYINPGYFG